MNAIKITGPQARSNRDDLPLEVAGESSAASEYP
jgi:hypothetical protein